jgi:predicted enzyme related to lactoylglutathione lyase
MEGMSTQQRTYPHGVPCWVDTEQPDAAAAADFYSGLFGWTLTDAVPPDAPGTYYIATLDGQDVAGVGPGEGPVRWHTYLKVDDAEAAMARVTAAGGTVTEGPVSVGPGGRWVALTDPAGAAVRLWEPGRRLGSQLVNAPGTWNFSNLHTGDRRVLDFYSDVFGWEVETLGEGEYVTMIRVPGYGAHLAATADPEIYERQAGAQTPPGFADAVGWVKPTSPDERPYWEVAFTVADRDGSAATAERLGAKVVSSTDTEWTKEAVIVDPQGATLTLSQFTPPNETT